MRGAFDRHHRLIARIRSAETDDPGGGRPKGVHRWQGNCRRGEILREEFLVPLKLTPYAVAAALNVARTRIESIAREEKPGTADTALRLGKFFKTGAAFWMNMQARFDLETAEDALAPPIRKIASYRAA